MENEVIGRLRAEHAAILRMLMEAKELCVSSLVGHEKLWEARRAMLEHLDREDSELYDVLRERASGDPRLSSLLHEAEGFTREVSEFAHRFFDNYDDDCKSMDFIRDFGTLMVMFRNRVRLEEDTLFGEFVRKTGGAQ